MAETFRYKPNRAYQVLALVVSAMACGVGVMYIVGVHRVMAPYSDLPRDPEYNTKSLLYLGVLCVTFWALVAVWQLWIVVREELQGARGYVRVDETGIETRGAIGPSRHCPWHMVNRVREVLRGRARYLAVLTGDSRLDRMPLVRLILGRGVALQVDRNVRDYERLRELILEHARRHAHIEVCEPASRETQIPVRLNLTGVGMLLIPPAVAVHVWNTGRVAMSPEVLIATTVAVTIVLDVKHRLLYRKGKPLRWRLFVEDVGGWVGAPVWMLGILALAILGAAEAGAFGRW